MKQYADCGILKVIQDFVISCVIDGGIFVMSHTSVRLVFIVVVVAEPKNSVFPVVCCTQH